MSTLVIVFVRPATPGLVKTRLIPTLGAHGTAALYRAFAIDVLATAQSLRDADVELWVAGDAHHPDLDFCPPRLPRHLQTEGDLGARMAAALEHGASRYARVLLMGSDVPTYPRSHLELARERLSRADVVLGPVADGGYAVIGARRVERDMFRNVRWSSRHACSDTRAACLAAGLDTGLVAPWYDVDEPTDLWTLRAELCLNPWAAPATARALGISF